MTTQAATQNGKVFVPHRTNFPRKCRGVRKLYRMFVKTHGGLTDFLKRSPQYILTIL